ncbi:hypothetical protein LOTGIDRAFT_160695 [Lottia gigantea]|uniref:Uncharacterized protein n=1 Tax=Lottia gigantea TaxID=225164 RepID=V4AL92_LOTGI|nr:hypothetical protein LOTGIDRAFT_160695 [Lottia gigantea]ESO95530.1 hypothetical protein LOTGIDRAFT_160695 [Lottia gigantea]
MVGIPSLLRVPSILARLQLRTTTSDMVCNLGFWRCKQIELHYRRIKCLWCGMEAHHVRNGKSSGNLPTRNSTATLGVYTNRASSYRNKVLMVWRRSSQGKLEKVNRLVYTDRASIRNKVLTVRKGKSFGVYTDRASPYGNKVLMVWRRSSSGKLTLLHKAILISHHLESLFLKVMMCHLVRKGKSSGNLPPRHSTATIGVFWGHELNDTTELLFTDEEDR